MDRRLIAETAGSASPRAVARAVVNPGLPITPVSAISGQTAFDRPAVTIGPRACPRFARADRLRRRRRRRERETRPNDPTPANLTAANPRIATRAESRGHGAPASSPGGGLRPASRGSAKPAPTTLRPANLTAANGVSPPAQNHGDMERRPVLPVGASDRHRAGARNPHQQRCAPPISPLRTAYRHSR